MSEEKKAKKGLLEFFKNLIMPDDEDFVDGNENGSDTEEEEENVMHSSKETQSVSKNNNGGIRLKTIEVGEDISIATKICDLVGDNYLVSLNFEKTPDVIRAKMMDFLSGAIYVMKANGVKTSANTFIIAPNGTNVDSLGLPSDSDSRTSKKSNPYL